MAYRLYNIEVAQGITDFDDMRYHILTTHFIRELGKSVALVYREGQIGPFIVAYGIQQHEYLSIDWEQGYYFETLEEAYTKYIDYHCISV